MNTTKKPNAKPTREDLVKPLELELPIKTVSEMNMREHWAFKSKRAKAQRFACAMAVRPHAYRLQGMFPVVVTFTRIGAGTLDDDNLAGAFKACRDGVTDALGLRSDNDPRVSFRCVQRRGPRGRFSVEIRIETRGET